MYKVAPLKLHLKKYLEKHSLLEKWNKSKKLLEQDLTYPLLNFEKIILKHTVFYSFRLDKKYRGICLIYGEQIEIIMFMNHYR